MNSKDIPSTDPSISDPAGSNELNPSVAIDNAGDFVVSWDQTVAEQNGVDYDTDIFARLFNAAGTALPNSISAALADPTTEFQVNVNSLLFVSDSTHTPHDLSGSLTGLYYEQVARNSQVAMDENGNFIVTWEAFQDNDVNALAPESYGIYYRRFTFSQNRCGPDDLRNTAMAGGSSSEPRHHEQRPSSDGAGTTDNGNLFAYDQVNPAIAMDADGDYAIVWDGQGAQPNATDPTNTQLVTNSDDQGVFVRQFHAGTATTVDVNEAVTTEMTVNTTTAGMQAFGSIAMDANGDMIVVWQGNGVGDQHGVFFRRYTSSTDTAGPLVTSFQLSDGTSVNSVHSITKSVQAVVVNFDEALDSASATNLSNYAILCNGVELSGAIVAAYYTGRDTAYNLSAALQAKYGITIGQTNKYQVVLVFSSALANGTYQIVAKNSIRDAAGNPLASTGTNVNGGVSSPLFYVNTPVGAETLVSALPQSVSQLSEETPHAVASDAKGDTVAVWQDTNAGTVGIWAELYSQTSTPGGNASRNTAFSPLLAQPIHVSADATAIDVSVAMDKSGDFVVTWSAQNSSTGWDVYAEVFNPDGSVKVSTFMVNSTTLGTQNDSSVAMDAEGDFAVTWQSLLPNSTTGYDIDAQRYSAAGQVLGGVNEQQAIIFTSGFTGTFTIHWDDDNNPATADKVTSTLTYNGNALAIADAVAAALQAIGADVTVTTASLTELIVSFQGKDANRDLSLMGVSNVTAKTGSVSNALAISVVTNGVGGEFRVNDTTAGNQMYPDIAMDDTGAFVITWTSYGQDGDSAINGNIYAKDYSDYWVSWADLNAATKSTVSNTTQAASTTTTVSSNVQEKATTVDDPVNHEVNVNAGYSGVVQVWNTVEGSYGSGSLLAGTDYILTAAHVVCHENFQRGVPDVRTTPFISTRPTAAFAEAATQIIVCPTFDGDPEDGGDIALIQIAAVPDGVTGYELYTGTDEVSQTFQLYGYGSIGYLSVGEQDNTANVKHTGENTFDCTGTTLAGTMICVHCSRIILIGRRHR